MGKGEEQIQFTFTPVVVPQGDGSYLVRPGKPVGKLSLSAAAKRAGLSRTTLWRLYDCGLVAGERPSPRKILIYADSLEAHLKGTREDPEYWDGAGVRERWREGTRGTRTKE